MTVESRPNKGLTAKSHHWVGKLRIEIPEKEKNDGTISFLEHLMKSNKAQARDNEMELKNKNLLKKQSKKKDNIPENAENRIVNEQTIVYK